MSATTDQTAGTPEPAAETQESVRRRRAGRPKADRRRLDSTGLIYLVLVGATVLTWLQDTVARETEYWRAMMGGVILLLVMLFPVGIAGALKQRFIRPQA